MASKFGGVGEMLMEMGNQRRQAQAQNQNQAMQQLQAMIAAKESGYNIQPFGGGYNVSEDPSGTGLKQLQKQKLINELDPNYEANRAAAKEQALIGVRKKAFGSFYTPGDQSPSGQMNPDQNQPFVMDPISGKPVKNPAYLDALNKEKLVQLQSKKQAEVDAENNKAEMARQNAEGQLNAIREAKKGIKYFGPAGNLPTVLAPSSLPMVGGEYGPRKEWENNVNKLLSGRIIDLMNQMKSASKTGATGFGQLSQKELQLLQGASNVLSKDLPPDIAKKYLDQLEPIYQKMLTKGQPQAQGNQTQNSDPVIKTGVDQETGKRVGMTQSGKIIPLD